MPCQTCVKRPGPHHRPDATGQPPPAQHCDFTRLGRHRLRAPNGAAIDLPVPILPGARAWVATIWPAPNAPGGWERRMWALDPVTGRGWQLPHQRAAGDVLEFGADTSERPMRWYGIMDSYEVDRWATVQGRYEHSLAAWEAAQRLLALERYVEPRPGQTAERRAIRCGDPTTRKPPKRAP